MPEGADHRVSSWLELQDTLFAGTWRGEISRFRSQFVDRGTQALAGGLATSPQNGGLVAHERHLLTSFRKRAPRSMVHGDWVWNWLSLAKHHGFPTRLLDWSYSPNVALHFATQDFRSCECDGAVWCVDLAEDERGAPGAVAGVSGGGRREHLQGPQQNLWIVGGSGSAPSR